LHGELESIIKSIEITSPTTYTFQGRSYSIDLDHIIMESSPDHTILKDYLVPHLLQTLYQSIHCRQSSFDDYNMASFDYNIVRNFTEELSQANTSYGTWQYGWQVQEIQGQELAIHKDGITLWTTSKCFIIQDGKVEVGKEGYVWMVKEWRELLPGYYMAFSNAPVDYEKNMTTTIRFYFNMMAAGAVELMRTLTAELNSTDVPFSFKTLNSPTYYTRADAAVLYIDKQYIVKSIGAISRIYHNVKRFLNESTPLFAKRLAPGFSLAEDPGNGESFGQHRCRILAESIGDIYTKSPIPTGERTAQVASYFKTLGLDLEKLYLNPNSVDDYELLFKAGGVFNPGE
jgi:hypothetical protein